jgi:hypothetical protein
MKHYVLLSQFSFPLTIIQTLNDTLSIMYVGILYQKAMIN